MATNFAYRKRQLELEKKRKKEEKLKRRQERGAGASGDDLDAPDATDRADDAAVALQDAPSGEGAGSEGDAASDTAVR